MLTKRAQFPDENGRKINCHFLKLTSKGDIMEIGNKILELRKKMGMSQEQLAEKMEVARQTISKWELGETSPDLSQAKKLSTIFRVSLDELANNDVKDIVVEKVSNIEKLAGMIIFIIKIGIGFYVGMIILSILSIIIYSTSRITVSTAETIREEITCTLGDKKYLFSVDYSEKNGTIHVFNRDEADFLDELTNYSNIDDLKNHLKSSIKEKGGTCEID